FNSGKPADTSTLTSAVKGKCLYVMDAQGNFYITARQWAPIDPLGFRLVNHSSSSAGHPVAAAGQLEVRNGKLISIDNGSGHYHPSNVQVAQAVAALERHGISKGSFKVDFKAEDHPGAGFIALDPEGEKKVKEKKILADRTPP